jgi:hypothetical protein
MLTNRGSYINPLPTNIGLITIGEKTIATCRSNPMNLGVDSTRFCQLQRDYDFWFSKYVNFACGTSGRCDSLAKSPQVTGTYT